MAKITNNQKNKKIANKNLDKEILLHPKSGEQLQLHHSSFSKNGVVVLFVGVVGRPCALNWKNTCPLDCQLLGTGINFDKGRKKIAN